MSNQIHRLQYGDTLIEYALDYAPRATLAISVAPDLRVTVTAPLGTAPEAVAERVRRRAPWILRQQRELERYLPAAPPRRYLSGETHRYLGRQYRLDLSPAAAEAVKLARGYLHIALSDPTDPVRVQALLEGWYQAQAQRVLPERLRAMLPRFQPLGIREPRLDIRLLQARWGSCTAAGTITLNLLLMQVPKHCIDYVVVHELCHLAEHNHGPRFYRLLDRMLPDWRERRRQLNECEVFPSV
ncbi:MAG: SprT family zinc-dependent metalloprotease [Roseiflexaceae bacterium]